MDFRLLGEFDLRFIVRCVAASIFEESLIVSEFRKLVSFFFLSFSVKSAFVMLVQCEAVIIFQLMRTIFVSSPSSVFLYFLLFCHFCSEVS